MALTMWSVIGVLLCLGWTVSAQSIASGDCLDFQAFDYFRFSPSSSYTPSDGLDGTKCSQLCTESSLPHAGLVAKKYCLCADESDYSVIRNIAKVTDELCDESDHYVRYFSGRTKRQVQGFTVRPSKEVAFVGEDVYFDLGISSGTVEYMVDFGDGSDATEWSAANSIKHQYYISGLFTVTAKARLIDNPEDEAIEISSVRVHSEVNNDIMQMTCPTVVEPDDSVDCNVTVILGTQLQMKIDFGDGIFTPLTNLPDIPMKTIGISIPQLHRKNIMFDKEDELKSYEFVVRPVPEGTLGLLGAVIAVEGYGAQPGQMWVYILRKVCSNEQDCTGNSVSCFEPGALCSSSKSCNNDCQPFYKKRVQYRIVKKFDLLITEGQFYLTSRSSFRLFSDDLVAFKMNDAQLAYRNLHIGETPDYKIEMPSDSVTVFDSDKFKPVENRKYYIRLIVSEPLTFTMFHSYANSGHYPIRFILKNNFNPKEVRRDSYISVQSTISKMRLMVNPPNAAVGQKVDIIAQLNKGSNIKLIWEYGDGNQTVDHVPNIRNNQKFVKSYQYFTPGIYQIGITASNLQGNTSSEHEIVIEHPVLKLWKISSDSPKLLPDPVRFTLGYPEESILPSNATVFVTFGDGKRFIWKVVENSEEWNGEYIISHVYNKSGVYNVDIEISNVVSKIKRRFQVDVLKKITGLQVSATNLMAQSQSSVGIKPTGDYIALNTTMNFNISVDSGDVEYYLVRMNDDIYKNTTESQLNVTFMQTGFYNLSFYGYNHIQNLSQSYSKSLFVLEPVKGMEIIDVSNDTIEPETKRFVIEIHQIGTNSCLLVDFGERNRDEDDFYTFGDAANCHELFPNYKTTHNLTLVETMEISKKYVRPSDYFLKFTLSNALSKVSQELMVTVLEIDCKPPIITIKNQIYHWKGATQVWRSKPVQLYSKSLVDCNATATITRFWQAFRVDEETGSVIKMVDLSHLDSYSKSFLYVPAFELEAGVYKFQFVINMTSPYPHPVLPLSVKSSTYVKVVPSPIIVRLTEGAQSRVVRGWGQKLVLAPRKESIDPDDALNKNFEIKWYCRRLPDEHINNLLPDERQNFSEPIYDRSTIDEQWGDDDGGGCFGQGPGRINITADEIEWNTTFFRKPGVTYEVVIQIIPPDREPSWGALQLVLLDSLPPSVVVQCQTKALCYPHYPIGQKINPVRVGLEGKCTESCEGELTYIWNIYGVSNGSDVNLPEAKKFVVGFDEPKMALGMEFFQEYYPKFKDFFVRLTIFNELGLKGESDIFLHINQPPESGECVLKQKHARALLDRVDARCSLWVDPEDKPIDFYAFWIRNLNDGVLSFLMYGPDKSVQLVLPYGNFTIGADIRDKEGALTRVEMATMATELPSQQEYHEFMSSKVLDNTDASGDQALMSMVAQSLSSLMNINFGHKSGTTTTTTTTTTTASYDYVDEDQIEREALMKARIAKSVSTMMNVDTINSLEQVGSALTALAGKGKSVDNEAKDVIIQLLNKTISLASNLQVESPQQLLDFCRFAVGTMGGIVNRMSEQIVSGIVLPTDRSKAWNLDYKVEVPDVDDEPDYIMDSSTSVEDALKKAVIRAERQRAELQIRQMIDLTIELVLAILQHIVVGEKPIDFVAPSGLTLTIAMFPKGTLSGKVIKHGDSTYVFPHVCDILAHIDCYGNETLGVLAVSWPSILESFGNSVDLLSEDTKTLQLLVINETKHIIEVRNTSQPFSIIVPRKSAESVDAENTLPEPTYVVPKMKFYESMIYHQVMVEKADSAVNIEITPSNNNSELLLLIKHGAKPLFDYYDILIPLRTVKTFGDNDLTYSMFLSNTIIQNKTGFFYVGVVEVDRDELQSSPVAFVLDEIIINENVDSNYTITNYTLPGTKRDFTTNYSMRIFTSGCYFYDYYRKIWSAEGCLVESANYAMTHCKCNHLTSFGSGFFVMPNSIDFSYILVNAGFADNVTIYMTIIITLCLYALLITWARQNDRKDLIKLGSTPLPDNEPNSKYLYEILVYTGDKDGAATDSKIQFTISGEDDESGVRTLEDPFRKAFRRGDTNSFVMAVPKKLGRLNYMRIWHDNSGEGKFRSWFLSFIVVKDIQTGEKYEFICNKWLAVEKDDGLIDRLLPVAGRDEATEFTHLFHQTTQKNLADGHLWFSIFLRPPRSRFTRVQRVSCCMAMLYLSMLANAMWYERVPSKPTGSSFEFGPFSLSPEQIGVGFMSNIIVFPATFLIILLFRKSRLRKLRPSRITEALKKQKVFIEKMRVKSSASLDKEKDYSSLGKEGGKERERVIKKTSTRLTLPFYCRYIGWALCFLSIFVSIFFLWAYGIQFGDEKTRKWITSLIISFFASVLVTQPVKVFLTAIILSTIFKSPDVDIDDSEEDEDDIDLSVLEEDEEWLHESYSKTTRSRMYRSPNMTLLEKIKLQRLKEIKMIMILKDIFSYLCFLWILTVISYGNRDPSAYLMKETMVKSFMETPSVRLNYMNIKNTEDMWRWVNDTLIPNLLIGDWYNSYKPLGLRGYLNDRVNRMMGYGILRQVRIKPNTCKTEIHFEKIFDRCRAFSNIVHEDQMSYQPEWKGESEYSYVNESLPLSKKGYLNPSKSLKDEWNYRSPSELDGLPFIGKLDAYSGGGYVLPLKGSREELRARIETLLSQNWIDERTRAVIAEFSVYNAQANLFGIVSCVLEFQPGGGIIPNYRIDVIRLMRYHQGFGLFVILCEVFYLSFVIYFTVRELRLWRSLGRAYLKSYWNWAELFVIIISYIAIALYIYRIILTNKILSVFHNTHGNGYIKLQYVSTVDELFGYLLAFNMFVSILKFIKLLRFNKRMGVLYATLAQCSKDLKSFSIVFSVVFFAFVQMFYLLFGLTMKEYSSFVNSAETTFGMVTGKFNFESMVMAAPLLGPIVFFVFVLCTSIILVNIFLTLIISAFETVKHDVMKQDNEYEIVEFMVNKFKSLFGLYRFQVDFEEKLDEKEKRMKQLEEQMAILPERIDHLMSVIQKKQHGQGGKGCGSRQHSSEVVYDVLLLDQMSPRAQGGNSGGRGTRRHRRRSQHNQTHSHVPKVAFLDWNEITD